MTLSEVDGLRNVIAASGMRLSRGVRAGREILACRAGFDLNLHHSQEGAEAIKNVSVTTQQVSSCRKPFFAMSAEMAGAQRLCSDARINSDFDLMAKRE